MAWNDDNPDKPYWSHWSDAMPNADRKATATFDTPALRQVRDQLARLIAGRDPVHVVLGDSGSGKSTLLKTFLDGSHDRHGMCRITLRLPRSSGSGSEKVPITGTTATYCLHGRDAPVVLIDDAHELTEPELAYLLKCACGMGPGRQMHCLVLFTEPDMRPILNRCMTACPPTAAVNTLLMPALTEAETAAYIAFRFEEPALKPLGRRKLRAIHEASGGLPGRIDAALADAYPNAAREWGAPEIS